MWLIINDSCRMIHRFMVLHGSVHVAVDFERFVSRRTHSINGFQRLLPGNHFFNPENGAKDHSLAAV